MPGLSRPRDQEPGEGDHDASDEGVEQSPGRGSREQWAQQRPAARQGARGLGRLASVVERALGVDEGKKPGLNTDEREEHKRLRREVKVLEERGVLEKSRPSSPRKSGPVKILGFIVAKKAEYSITITCRVLEVSRSKYHAWAGRPPSARALEDERLTARIEALHKKRRKVCPFMANSKQAFRLKTICTLIEPVRLFYVVTDETACFSSRNCLGQQVEPVSATGSDLHEYSHVRSALVQRPDSRK